MFLLSCFSGIILIDTGAELKEALLFFCINTEEGLCHAEKLYQIIHRIFTDYHLTLLEI